jgi:ABC-type uncharacterized transport system ATPase subunit
MNSITNMSFQPKNIPEDEDEDVKEERKMVQGETETFDDKLAIKIKNLYKEYPPSLTARLFKKDASPFVSVNNLCLTVEENTLLCLLGPNGAGKVENSLKFLGNFS